MHEIWEYKFVKGPRVIDDPIYGMMDEANKWGLEGWEVYDHRIGGSTGYVGYSFVLYMKRRVIAK